MVRKTALLMLLAFMLFIISGSIASADFWVPSPVGINCKTKISADETGNTYTILTTSGYKVTECSTGNAYCCIFTTPNTDGVYNAKGTGKTHKFTVERGAQCLSDTCNPDAYSGVCKYCDNKQCTIKNNASGTPCGQNSYCDENGNCKLGVEGPCTSINEGDVQSDGTNDLLCWNNEWHNASKETGKVYYIPNSGTYTNRNYDVVASGKSWYWCDSKNNGRNNTGAGIKLVGAPPANIVTSTTPDGIIKYNQYLCYINEPDTFNSESFFECCGASTNNCKSGEAAGVKFVTGQKIGDYVCTKEKKWTLLVYYHDFDNDTYGDLFSTIPQILPIPPKGYVSNSLDCNDTNKSINITAIEVCNKVDDNCNGQIDEGNLAGECNGTCSGTATQTATSCSSFTAESPCKEKGCSYTLGPGPCTGTRPDCSEYSDSKSACEFIGCSYKSWSCAGIRPDCSGYSNSKSTCEFIGCSYNPTTATCYGTATPCSSSPDSSHCQTMTGCSYNPTTATCYGEATPCSSYTDSSNCQGVGCSWPGTCSGTASAAISCNSIFNSYVCAEKGCTWKKCTGADNDGDGYSTDSVSDAGKSCCFDASGNAAICNSGADCDDSNSSIHYGAEELCNGVDDNCNEVVDEGCAIKVYWKNLNNKIIETADVGDEVNISVMGGSPETTAAKIYILREEKLIEGSTVWEILDNIIKIITGKGDKILGTFEVPMIDGQAWKKWTIPATIGNYYAYAEITKPEIIITNYSHLKVESIIEDDDEPIIKIIFPTPGQVLKTDTKYQFRQSSSDSDSSLEYKWDFGNGVISTEPNPAYTYVNDAKEGSNYINGGPTRIKLTVTQKPGGGSKTVSFKVLVNSSRNDPPLAIISSPVENQRFTSGTIVCNATLSIDDETPLADMNFTWEFDDEDPGFKNMNGTVGRYFTKNYNKAGEWVKLTVTA